MNLIEDVIPRRRRRRWLWYASTAFKKHVHVTYDGGLDLWSPVKNFTARQTFVAGYRDPAVFAWLENFLMPGMTVFDVGANVGVYALFIARRIGPSGVCYAFEPNPDLRKFLEENKKSNRLENIDLNFVGTGETKSLMEFVDHRANIGQNHIAGGGEASKATRKVPIVRLDDFVEEHAIENIDFVKMDIEGFELQALRGFKRTMERCKKIIVHTEIEPRHMKRYGNSPELLMELMQGLGFIGHALTHDGFSPIDATSKAKDVFWSRIPLSFPKESGVGGVESLALAQ